MERPAKLRRLNSWTPLGSMGDPPLADDWEQLAASEPIDDEHLLLDFYPFQDFDAFTRFESSTDPTRKRDHEIAFSNSPQPHTEEHFPGYLPQIAAVTAVVPGDLCRDNPFIEDNGISNHPALQRVRGFKPVAQPSIHFDGLLKGRIDFGNSDKKKNEMNNEPIEQACQLHQLREPIPAHTHAHPGALTQSIPRLPSQFGAVRQETDLDRKLFDFFERVICTGRTVIPEDNTYLLEVLSMAENKPVVNHTILALSASYLLDYISDDMIEPGAEYHHHKAVKLLDEELKDVENLGAGKGDFLVATLILLSHNECINWEEDRIRENSPKWYRAATLAERILDCSDPSSVYQIPNNVQLTPARSQLANRVCLDSVLSDCVYPTDWTSGKCKYSWLILGTERERRRIIGFTGLCPDLMHIFVKITHLSARRSDNPSSLLISSVGQELEQDLEKFWQLSKLAPECKTTQALLESCKLGRDGKVTSAEDVTRLVAESYVIAAQIYLQCRLFRKRRSDPMVQELLHKLLWTIDHQPVSGMLFTAQSPLFSVFIGGIVAYKPEDRDMICTWFDTICSGVRGNLLPAYNALKHIWEWLDVYEDDRSDAERKMLEAEERMISYEDFLKLDSSDAWWEHVVMELSSEYGRINLA